MRKNTYKHTSRTYFDIYNALTSAYPNSPTWLFNEMAGLFDFTSELMNRVANDILYPSTREAAYGFAARCDYTPVEADGATATLTITLTGAMAKTITAGTQFGGISSATGDFVVFEVTANASSGGGSSISASVKQTETKTSVDLGTVTGTDDFADYPIDGYLNIIKDSISLVIDGNSWTRVENFDNSISTDKHFKILYQANGKARLQFGNDSTGAKPPVNETIYGTFKVTKGNSGKMEIGEINVDIAGDSDISSLTNAAATSGGNDSESVDSIIRNSSANVRLRDAVWSVEDLETAARSASSSVQKALGVGALGAAIIQVIPSGGGNPSGALKTAVDNYVTALTQFGIMPITVNDPSYVTVNVTATVTVRSGFTAGTVRNLVEFAMNLATSAIDNEIIEYYDDNGIDACRTDKINTIYALAFTSDENDALAFIIDQWKDLLGDRYFREWGQPLEVGDLWIMGNGLYDYGVDVFALSAPTTNTSASATQIIDTGTVTIS